MLAVFKKISKEYKKILILCIFVYEFIKCCQDAESSCKKYHLTSKKSEAKRVRFIVSFWQHCRV